MIGLRSRRWFYQNDDTIGIRPKRRHVWHKIGNVGHKGGDNSGGNGGGGFDARLPALWFTSKTNHSSWVTKTITDRSRTVLKPCDEHSRKYVAHGNVLSYMFIAPSVRLFRSAQLVREQVCTDPIFETRRDGNLRKYGADGNVPS